MVNFEFTAIPCCIHFIMWSGTCLPPSIYRGKPVQHTLGFMVLLMGIISSLDGSVVTYEFTAMYVFSYVFPAIIVGVQQCGQVRVYRHYSNAACGQLCVYRHSCWHLGFFTLHSGTSSWGSAAQRTFSVKPLHQQHVADWGIIQFLFGHVVVFLFYFAYVY